MTLDFIEELEDAIACGEMPCGCPTQLICLCKHEDVQTIKAILFAEVNTILIMAKALKAADRITCFSCMQSYGEGGVSDCEDTEHCGPYRKLRAEVGE